MRKLFSEHGEVAEVRIMVDRKTSVPRGYGFVRYMVSEHSCGLRGVQGRRQAC